MNDERCDRDPKTHELKTTVRPYFEALWAGTKTFEWRVDDRGFAEGDTLILREYEPATGIYGGRAIVARVGFLLRDTDGSVIMSLLDVERSHG